MDAINAVIRIVNIIRLSAPSLGAGKIDQKNSCNKAYNDWHKKFLVSILARSSFKWADTLPAALSKIEPLYFICKRHRDSEDVYGG